MNRGSGTTCETWACKGETTGAGCHSLACVALIVQHIANACQTLDGEMWTSVAYWVSGKARAEWNSLPRVTRVVRVEQDGGLANNPPLAAAEAHAVESVVEVLVLCGRDGLGLPAVPAVVGLKQSLACAQEEACRQGDDP